MKFILVSGGDDYPVTKSYTLPGCWAGWPIGAADAGKDLNDCTSICLEDAKELEGLLP